MIPTSWFLLRQTSDEAFIRARRAAADNLNTELQKAKPYR
jgi:hypothetical protein